FASTSLGLSVAWLIFSHNTGVAGVAPTHTTGQERKQQPCRLATHQPGAALAHCASRVIHAMDGWRAGCSGMQAP
ncbi:MAG: hypothetical protein P8163_19275, partial [Candidatus Thiodiazotropha sp.]